MNNILIPGQEMMGHLVGQFHQDCVNGRRLGPQIRAPVHPSDVDRMDPEQKKTIDMLQEFGRMNTE